MAKSASKAAVAIQRLLDERQQLQIWLERLAEASDNAPDHVRQRVQDDYERRLKEVLKELKGYEDELTANADRQRTTRAGLSKQEREAAERLAEAELRHSVGEYDESQWRQVHTELQDSLTKLREELAQADEELGRLDDVLHLVTATPSAPAPRAADPSRSARQEAVTSSKSDAPAKSGRKQTDAFDELAFLRSVTEDERQGPAPSRAGGGLPAMVEPQAESAKSGYADPETKKDASPRSSKTTKSLKCGECGTMNLPTEWYCERCGAELAAL